MKVPKGLDSLRESLKQFKIREHVLYFLVDGDEVVYVGVTENLGSRITAHRVDRSYIKNMTHPRKEFDSVFYLEMKSGKQARAIENIMIKVHRPKYNCNLKPKLAAAGAMC